MKLNPSALLAVLMLRGGRAAAAFAASSELSSAAAARGTISACVAGPALLSRCHRSVAPPNGGGGNVRAFIVAGRLRAGGATSRSSSPSFPLGGPLRASTQEAAVSSAANDEEERAGSWEIPPSLRADISAAAAASSDIAGPSTSIATFGGLPYVDTSLLDSSVPKQHRVLFVLGGPGAGKGTQSDMIVSEYKCVHLSVGELLRAERRRGDDSPHADLIEDALVNGKIVPVEISLELLRNAMDVASASPAADGKKYGSRIFLVDGFPRNFDNLSGWTRNMPASASTMGVLCYDCRQDVLEARILGRAETSGRSDDNLESARKRFRTFQEQTMPVVMALEEVERADKEEKGGGRGGMSPMRVDRIRAEGTVEDVWDLTRESMDEFVRNDVLSASARLMEAVDNADTESYAALCDPTMVVDGEQEVGGNDNGGDVGSGSDRARRIFDEYEVARVEMPGDAPADAIKTPALKQTNEVGNAEVKVVDGTHAVVSYDRIMKLSIEGSGQEMESAVRETRVWEHGESGWTCVHFYRKPL